MKKLLVMAMTAATFAGCMKAERTESADRAWTDHGYANGGTVVTKVVEIEGHRYVIMSGLKQGGIIHAESCPCKSRPKPKTKPAPGDFPPFHDFVKKGTGDGRTEFEHSGSCWCQGAR